MATPEIAITLIIMLGLGLIAGVLGSILGIGGGLIVTPILTWVLGLDIKYAIASSIIVVIATSSGSAIAYLKDKVINLKAAMFLEIFTTLGGICGALIAGIVAPWILYILFSMMLIYSAVNGIFKIKNKKSEFQTVKTTNTIANKLTLNSSYYDDNLKRDIEYNVTNVFGGSAIMFGAGIASGLLGIGSGIFKVIAMDNVMKIPLKPSSATSNLMMGVTAASSAIIYFFKGQILPQICVPVCLGVIIGATIGSKIMPKLNSRVIRIIFVPTVLIFGIQMLIKAFYGA